MTYGFSVKKKVGCGTMYIHFHYSEDSERLESVRITLGKSGGCASAQTEALGEIVSWGLKSGGNILELSKLLKGIGCHQPIHDGATSCADALAKTINQMYGS